MVHIYIGQSLLWVAALGLVVIYIYSVGTFVFLPNEFHDPNEDAENVRFCRSLIQCFISVMEYGLLDTLGLVSSNSIIIIILLCMHRLQVYQQTSKMLL